MSGEAILAAAVLGTLFFLLASGVWIGVALLIVGFVALFFFTPAPAGSLLAMMNGFVNPDLAGFQHSVELVTMVVLGGLGSVVGSIVGAAVLVVLPQALTVFQEYENLMLGFIIIVSMVFMRDGIVPMASKLMARAR